MIQSLNVSFNPNAMKNINEVCKCEQLEGVLNGGDDLTSDDKTFKP
jgi:hypothetical protein